MKYYDTYYFCEIVQASIENPAPYARSLESYFGEVINLEFLEPYPKTSALHRYIEFVFWQILDESVTDVVVDALVHDDDYTLWACEALDFYSISYTTFNEWQTTTSIDLDELSESHIYEYYLVLQPELDQLARQISSEVFFLLFMNRSILWSFHKLIAGYIDQLVESYLPVEHARFFTSGDNLRLRRTRIPAWVTRAVYYRDRGKCTSCHKDISGLVNLTSRKNFDHIYPLSKGGTNEVTNLQLLCSSCNSSKGADTLKPTLLYEKWF